MPTLAVGQVEGEEEGSIYQRMDHPAKHNNTNPHGHGGEDPEEKLFSLQFIKKYLLYAKATCEPVLTDEVRLVNKKKKNRIDVGLFFFRSYGYNFFLGDSIHHLVLQLPAGIVLRPSNPTRDPQNVGDYHTLGHCSCQGEVEPRSARC